MVQVVNQGKNLDVTWTEPKQVEFFAVTMYSVEGKCGTGEWKEVGRIWAEFGAKLRLFDYKKLDINILQVNAIYDDGTSVQSKPSETFDYNDNVLDHSRVLRRPSLILMPIDCGHLYLI